MNTVSNVIRVYDTNMKKTAYLENAYNIGYTLKNNELWTAQFTLPASDKKNVFCQSFYYVEIFDGGERIELFRIMPSTLTRNNKGDIVYTCEHVLATLLDDVLFQYHQAGGTDVGTVPVLRYVLDRQIIKRWQLRTCDFDKRLEYKWENENLLAALFSIPQVFNEGYRWEFDTTGTIWHLDLKRAPTQFKADVIYKKNMTEIKKEVDPSTIVTRLYCLGYGEGDNQLTISSINNGIPYLEANIGIYGIKSSILADRKFESAETLMAYGQTMLNELKTPFKSYTTKAVDLYRKSPDKYEKFFPGDIIRIIDKEDDIIEDLPIATVSKSDVTGAPGDITIEIAKKSRDIAGSISSLQDRTRINEVYAQGATNQMIVPFADNADVANPATMRIYIPESMARINKCILNYQLENFRAYSKAIGGGGGTTRSTNEGGASVETSGEGGGSTQTSDHGGATTQTSSGDGAVTKTSMGQNTQSSYATDDQVETQQNHNHGIPDGTGLAKSGGGTVYFYSSGSHSHRQWRHSHDVSFNDHHHSVSIPSHVHHVNVPTHYHSIWLPNHVHIVAIPDHIHELEFGIYEGGTANFVTIKVDGRTIPQTQPGEDIDIISYLATDEDGKIQRNAWHVIEIVPDQMTRILANIFMQIFTNSRGGGDF